MSASSPNTATVIIPQDRPRHLGRLNLLARQETGAWDCLADEAMVGTLA
jgi:hypothetical protein